MVMFFFHAVAIFLQLRRGAASSTAQTSTGNTLTCPSRTVNYLTHTLPQQCLTSSRSSYSSQVVSSSSVEPTAQLSTTSPTVVDHSTVSTSSDTVDSVLNYTSTTADDSTLTSTVAGSISVTTITSTTLTSLSSVDLVPEILDEESPLEIGNFLSFEEWRRQNLLRGGHQKEPQGVRKRPGSDHNSLDSFGDDAEIDLDFSGLVPGGPGASTKESSGRVAQDEAGTSSESTPSVKSRSKDAGTTRKERSNYASFDCGASILKSNPKAKSPTSILVENKDAYMLNECTVSDKFLVIELCNDIRIDTVVLANFEFFSSIFRHFRVSVSDRYPIKADKWKLLGTFEARNTRGIQAFLVEDPAPWARYVRIELLTHYGHEYYCPVSLVRIHGTTMMEEVIHSMDSNQEDDDEDDDVIESQDVVQDTTMHKTSDETLPPTAQEQPSAQTFPVIDASNKPKSNETYSSFSPIETDASGEVHTASICTPNDMLDINIFLLSDKILEMCYPDEGRMVHEVENALSESSLSTASHNQEASTTMTTATTGAASTFTPATNTQTSTMTDSKTLSVKSSDEAIARSQSPISNLSNGIAASSSTSTPPNSMSNTVKSADRLHSTTATSVDRSKQSHSSTQPHLAVPTMQESFFKSVQKRLQMLESNSSLSLQYIEEQSRSLRDAFHKVEQRQLYKTTKFLESLNATVLTELREFRQQYDQLWQSTVIELEIQREQYQHETQAMHARLAILADELIFQKRMSILQMALIIICLGLVLFSRGVIHNYLELPLVQSVLSKSPGSRWMNLSGETPNNTPELRRTRSAHQVRAATSILKRHRRLQSDDSAANANIEGNSPTELYSPLTPVSFDGFSDGEQSQSKVDAELTGLGDLDFDPSTIERPSTSPPNFSSPDEPSTPRTIEDLDMDTIDTRLLQSPLSRVEGGTQPDIKIEGPSPPSKHLKWALQNAQDE